MTQVVKKTTTKKVPLKIGIHEALANFQMDMPPLAHNSKGYGYTYTDLGEIITKAKPILFKHGLMITQPLEGSKLKTILHHIPSKEEIIGWVEIPQDVELRGQNSFQVYGSALTYFRRYCYVSQTGIVSDADSDASGQEVKKEKPAQKSWPTISEVNFKKLVDAFGSEDKEGNTIDIDWCVKRYHLSPSQMKQIKEVANG